MDLKRRAIAGTMESSDVMIEIIPWNEALQINLKSDVQKQYGKQILKLVNRILKEEDICNAQINITDKGALDFAISARLKTALYRASK